MTAAASDARMGGSMLPVMSNSGSNQGLTVTLPVIAVAKVKGGEDALIRALVQAHLAAIHTNKQPARFPPSVAVWWQRSEPPAEWSAFFGRFPSRFSSGEWVQS